MARFDTLGVRFTCCRSTMKFGISAVTIVLALLVSTARAQSSDLESRINELEAALDHLQERIERLERQQTPPHMSEKEAAAVLRTKEAADACTEQLGPAPEFAPVLGTKVNPEYMTYLKKHRACVREKGVEQ